MEKFIYEGIEINNIDEWWKKQNYYFSHSTKDFQKFRKATDDFIWQFIREDAKSDIESDYELLDFVEELFRENDFIYNHLYEAQTDAFDIEEGWADQDYIYKDINTDDCYALFVRITRCGIEFPCGFNFRKVIPLEETIIKYIDED